MRRSGLVLCLALTLSACLGGGDDAAAPDAGNTAPQAGSPPPPPAPRPPPPEPPDPEPPLPPVGELDDPDRAWKFMWYLADGSLVPVPDGTGSQQGGVVFDEITYGNLGVVPPGPEFEDDGTADGEVYSSESGRTYWVEAEAPIGRPAVPTDPIGSFVELRQSQTYRKITNAARLEFLITEVNLNAMDLVDATEQNAECAAAPLGEQMPKQCTAYLTAQIDITFDLIELTNPSGGPWHASYRGTVQLLGRNKDWGWNYGYTAHSHPGLVRPIFDDAEQFHFIGDVFPGALDKRATVKLKQPIPVNIDLKPIPVGAEFRIVVLANARTWNVRPGEGESYVSARLRDPLTLEGMTHTISGLLPTNRELGELIAEPVGAPACSADPLPPSAGKVQFAKTHFRTAENGPDHLVVQIERVGGSTGTVIANFRTVQGTAIEGKHYEPVQTLISFGDGDDTPQFVRIPVLNNDEAEGDRTIELALTGSPECAVIGLPASAILTIVDDDVAIDNYRVSGTISGLLGTGLEIEEVTTGIRVEGANGPFEINYAFSDGDRYDVRIRTQPTNPTQICSVANATGTIDGASVANVEVTCEEPEAPPAGLDPSFGDNGRVAGNLPTGASAMALQSDGRIVLLGGMRLTRYNADGTLDTTFGTAGIVNIPLFHSLDEMLDVAVQPDDKIVVVGATRVGTKADMAVLRFNADGTTDTSFGVDGMATIDPYGGVPEAHHHSANRVIIQPDGRILVAGNAGIIGASINNNFAVARFNPDGTPDTSFDEDGASTLDVAGTVDLGQAFGLQSDGKVVVAGRAGDNSQVDMGIARFLADGQFDADYGRNDTGADVWPLSPFGNEAKALVVLPNDSIVVAANVLLEEPTGFWYRFALAPVGADGILGTVVQTPFSEASHDIVEAMAMQPDGKVIVVGQVAGPASFDMAVVRYNADLSLDTSFGDGGIMRIDFFGASDTARDVLIQPDGKILVAGVARNGSTNGLGLVRINP